MQSVGSATLRRSVELAVMRQDSARRERLGDLPDPDKLKSLAGAIKQHTLDHLDFYLDKLVKNVQFNGGHVHFASTAEDAKQIILDIARRANCSSCIKSKSMASEEIDLAHALEAAGLDVVETDLGEFIVQISHDRPSHLVAPIVHKDRASISRLFSEYFSTPLVEDAESLTMQARSHLREKFRRADLGITGGNFLVAETGQVCVVENEGNARHSITSPRVLISLVGIEKLIPRLSDLSVMLKLLARSATGQHMTVYTSLFGRPRSTDERDGPDEFHLVLLDNGRSDILTGDYREVLRCIRCGACLNTCPVYRRVGGHAYRSVYPGPIGAIITPLLQGLERFKDLPHATSLCGACYEVCPVKIDLPRHLINLRRDLVSRRITGRFERLAYRLWAWIYASRYRYGWWCRLQRWQLRRSADRAGWIEKLGSPASGWTQVRDMPAPAPHTFHQLWKRR